jgi:hypothetical protein
MSSEGIAATLTLIYRNMCGTVASRVKVIRNVLEEVLKAAPEVGTSVHCIQKVPDDEANLPGLNFTTDNCELLGAIGTSCQVDDIGIFEYVADAHVDTFAVGGLAQSAQKLRDE